MAEPRTRFGNWLSEIFAPRRGERTVLSAGSGRATEPSYKTTLAMVSEYGATIPRDLVKQVYTLMWQLYLTIPDISRAATNNVNLANTGHRLHVEGNESRAAKAVQELNRLAQDCWYLPGGADAFVQHALLQQTIVGAVNCEPVMKSDLSGLDYIVPVPIDTIEFSVAADGRPWPCQRQSTGQLVELDPSVYLYLPVGTINDRPYAIPPFISSLTAVERQLKLDEQLQALLEVLCMWGLIAFPLKGPERNRGELEEAYYARVKAYNAEQLDALVKGMKNGVIGYPPVAGAPNGPTVQSTTNSANGIGQVTEFVDHRISSGVGQDLSLLGRNYAVSETHIRYHYYIQRNCLLPMQKNVKRALERAYRLHLAALGLVDVNPVVTFKAPKDLTALEDANTETVRRGNVTSDWLNGFITKEQAAGQLGYDAPANDELPWVERQAESAWGAGTSFEFNKDRNRYEFIQPSLPPMSFTAASNNALKARALALLAVLYPILGDASEEATAAAMGFLAGSVTAEAFAARAVTAVGNIYHDRLADVEVASRIVGDTALAFSYFRLEDSVLSGGRTPPDWTDLDSRVSRALADRPAYYMTKLAQTPGAQAQVRDYLQKEFLARGLSAADDAAVEAFRRDLRVKLGEMSQGRAENIVRTGMARIRTDAHIRQLYQDGIARFRYSFVLDGNTSEICLDLHRRFGTQTFDVAREHQRVLEDAQMSPEDWRRARDWGPLRDKNISPDELQRLGIAAPPFHGNCRTRIVAAIS